MWFKYDICHICPYLICRQIWYLSSRQMCCVSKTYITFVPFKCRQICWKMTFDVGKYGPDVIFDFILGEYVVGIVWITFVFKIIQFLFAGFGVTCSKVFNLSKLFFGFTFIFYFTCLMIASLEAWNSKEQLNVFIYAWWVANLKDNSNRNSTHKCSRLKNVLLKLLHCFTIL